MSLTNDPPNNVPICFICIYCGEKIYGGVPHYCMASVSQQSVQPNYGNLLRVLERIADALEEISKGKR